MKQIFKAIRIAVCLFTSILTIQFTAKAQTDSLQIVLNQVFQNIDKSQVPTGLLEEYGAQFVPLKTYNGVLTDSNNVNALAWHYIYATVYSSKISGLNTLPSPDSNYNVFNAEAIPNNDVNPVSILVLNYSSLKPDAVTNNLFSISNNQLYDVAGRTQSPYQLNTAFAAAPFYETDEDGVLNLIFKQNLFINNTGKQVSSIQVDFNTGNGFVTAAWNNVISNSYTTTGNKQLIIKLNFTDGSNLQCYSKVNILKAVSGANLYQPSNITIPFNPTNNNHSGGDITVQYSVNNTTPVGNRKFQKPFIVVEGFDVHDAAPLLSKGYGYNNFLDEINGVFLLSNGNNFNYNLDNIAGYDLIFLNYRDGTDDVLRNALLLEEVINYVNTNKDAGAQQNVVMGISMGGLVTRYCLAKMTKENHNPQTRLLITHDSPHRGANVPLGAQYLINDFANKKIFGLALQYWIAPLRQAVILQLRPATVEQLLVRDNPVTRNLEYNTFLAPMGPYRQMITFASTGPKPAYTFIATSQGSQCGVAVMPPSAVIAQASASAGFSFIYGAFGTKLTGEVAINALPNGTASQRITYFDLKFKSKIFYITVTTTFMHFEHSSPVGILGYDGCPAGTRNIPIGNTGSHKKDVSYLLGLFRYSINFSGLQVQPAISFVPTVSALDEDNITATSLYAPHLGANFTPPSDQTLLQKYIAQQKTTDPATGVQIYNIEHTDFTARNANWIFNEMENINNQTVTCVGYNDCTTFAIAGPSSFCTTSGLYTIPNLPPGATIVWQVAPSGIATVNTPNALQTTLTWIANGLVTLSATVTTSCGVLSPVLNKQQITVGTPTISGTFINSKDGSNNPLGLYPSVTNPACTGYIINTNIQLAGATSFTWTKVSSTGVVNFTQTGNNIGFYLFSDNQNVLFKLDANNSCGTTSNQYKWLASACGGGGGCSAFSVYPTVTSDNNLKVISPNIPPPCFSASKKRFSKNDLLITGIRIYDNTGNLKRVIRERGTKQSKINLNGLLPGSYFIEITGNNNYKERQIFIKQ